MPLPPAAEDAVDLLSEAECKALVMRAGTRASLGIGDEKSAERLEELVCLAYKVRRHWALRRRWSRGDGGWVRMAL
jgi:hypothetical protein